MNACPTYWRVRLAGLVLFCAGAVLLALLSVPAVLITVAAVDRLWTFPWSVWSVLFYLLIISPWLLWYAMFVLAAVQMVRTGHRMIDGELTEVYVGRDALGLVRHYGRYLVAVLASLSAISCLVTPAAVVTIPVVAVVCAYVLCLGRLQRFMHGFPVVSSWWVWHEQTMSEPGPSA